MITKENYLNRMKCGLSGLTVFYFCHPFAILKNTPIFPPSVIVLVGMTDSGVCLPIGESWQPLGALSAKSFLHHTDICRRWIYSLSLVCGCTL